MNKYQLSELDLKKCALIINKLDNPLWEFEYEISQ